LANPRGARQAELDAAFKADWLGWRFAVRDSQPHSSVCCIPFAMLRTSAKGEAARSLRGAMNEFERRRASDAGAQLEGRALIVVAVVALLGFWQHYDNYVDAEESRASIASEQTGPTDESPMAVSETFEHPKMHAQLSDISRSDCRYR